MKIKMTKNTLKIFMMTILIRTKLKKRTIMQIQMNNWIWIILRRTQMIF